MVDQVYFSERGRKLNFIWIGEETNIIIYIIEGYSKLVFYRSSMLVTKNCNYYIQSMNDLKHKIYILYDEKEDDIVFKIENNYGNIDISLVDPDKYFMNIGKNLKHGMLAMPLFEIFLDGIYEHNKCKVEENDVVFDIGSNVGIFTYYSLYKKCKTCYSFEPNKKLLDVIKNKNINNVISENLAVSNENGHLDFIVSQGGISSSLEKDTKLIFDYNKDISFKGETIYEKIKAETVSIMDYIKKNNIKKIDFLKCDAEGSEYDIIEDIDVKYLRNNIHKMLIEYHNISEPFYKEKYKKMLNKLTKCGFKYECDRDVDINNDGILFLWKEKK